MHDAEIDGGGCDWIFHGLMNPVRLTECRGTTLRNVRIDWQQPYNSQATIVSATNTYVDMAIDAERYPYVVAGDSLAFVGSTACSCTSPNTRTSTTARRTNCSTRRATYRWAATCSGPGSPTSGTARVRFHYRPAMKPAPGSVVVFFHGRYHTNGIEIADCEQTRIEQVTIHHTLSCGVFGVRSHDIAMIGLDIVADEPVGARFQHHRRRHAFYRLHGRHPFRRLHGERFGRRFHERTRMYAPVAKVCGARSVRITPTSRDQGFRPGERVWPLDTATMQRGRPLTSAGTERIEGSRDLLLHFKEPIAGRIAAGNILENATLCPRLTVRNCRMLKKNRGRSILVTTPAKVLIENNLFRSAGAAVLIEGDTDLWFESGAVGDVTIRNNVFEDCYTSGNNIIDGPWGWGEAVISVSPSFRPQSADAKAYHRNIRIEGNTFRHFDYAVLFARSVEGLVFSRNRLERTRTYKPFYRPYNLFLDGCRKVRVEDNAFGPDFPGHNIAIEHMRPSEITQRGGRPLEIICK